MATRPPLQVAPARPLSRQEQSQQAANKFMKDLIRGREKQEKLFESLANCFDNQISMGVYVKRYLSSDLNSIDKRLCFKREAALYNRKMHNKFFVPIWAAAMDSEESFGYIMYPRLTPLTEVLPSLRIEEISIPEKEMRLTEVLRRCFAPVALALDALHTPVPNRRTMYYHRDLSITKIYLCESQGDQVTYGDAMLKLTKFTRGSHEDEMNVFYSIGSLSFPRQYFHHPEPWSPEGDRTYRRMHDWFSFGVYILEVLLRVLPVTSAPQIIRYPTVEGYEDLADKIESCVQNDIQWSNERTSPILSHYLSVAKKCISLEQDQEQVIHHEFSEDLRSRFTKGERQSFDPYNFDYGLSPWTADLLWLYDDTWTESAADFVLSRPCSAPGAKRKKKEKEVENVCQACLLHQTVKIPTQTFRRAQSRLQEDAEENLATDKALHCDDQCGTFYCASCHTNGERLFCPNMHGTTSSIFGHFSSYALILYGYHKDDIFMKDAHTLENVLKHKLIVGIPEDNVLVAPVFDLHNHGKEEECLEKACTDIRKRIHNRQVVHNVPYGRDICVNDASYTLFVYYSGHGCKAGSKSYRGHWCPTTEEHHLTWDVIDKHLSSLRECPNENNPTCEAACLKVISLMDHCGTYKKSFSLSVEPNPDGESPIGLRTASPFNRKADYSIEANSDITTLFCDFLRSKFCKEKTNCKYCNKIRQRISEDCHNSYLDSGSLELYGQHLPEGKRLEVVEEQSEKAILAHFFPSGVHYRIFPYREANDVVEVEFDFKMSCDELKKMVKTELLHKDRRKKFRYYWNQEDSMQICLLLNQHSDYSRFSLVCDSVIRNALDSSLLFYSVITEPAKVVLQAEGKDRTLKETLVVLELGASDLYRLVQECSEEDSNIGFPGTSQLPNLLVHIVHHIRYKVYHGGIPVESPYARQTSTVLPNSGTLQPTSSQDDSEIPDTELLWNNFAGLLYEPPRCQQQVKSFTTTQWRELEEEAMQYVRQNRRRVFDIQLPEASYARVKWQMSALPSPSTEHPPTVLEAPAETHSDDEGEDSIAALEGKEREDDFRSVEPEGDADAEVSYDHGLEGENEEFEGGDNLVVQT